MQEEFGWTWAFSHLSFFLYFLASMQEIPADRAVLRFLACLIFPLFFYWAFDKSSLFGLAIFAAHWLVLTKPSTGFSKEKFNAIIQKLLGFGKKSKEEEQIEDPYAELAFVDVVYPVIEASDKLEYIFGAKKTVKKIFPTSEVRWIFAKLNEFTDFLDSRAERHILWADFGEVKKLIQDSHAPDLFQGEDRALEGMRLFEKDLSYHHNPKKVNAVGRLLLNSFLVKAFKSRCSVVRYLRKNPEILQIPIQKPLFIVGMPRTGSTFLQALLAQDPNARHLRMWETNIPIPPPREENYEKDIRAEMIDRGLAGGKLIDAEFMSRTNMFHNISGKAAEEELLVMLHSTLLFSHYFLTGEGEFKGWFYDQNNKQFSYNYLRRFLQLVSSNYPARSHWVLKAPIHSLFLNALLAEFPDARIVVTHRNPTGVVTSWAHFEAQMLNIYTDLCQDNSLTYVQDTMYLLSQMAKRIVDIRKKHDKPEQFYDVLFENLVKNPIEVVRGIYQHFGLEFTKDYHERLKVFLEHEPVEGKSKAQKVSLSELGLTQEDINEEFAEYSALYLSA